jgi:DNA polymerase III alpha subunit
MYFVDMEDHTGLISMIVWPEQVKMFKDVIKKGNILSGKLKRDKGGVYIQTCFLEKRWLP